MAKTKALSDTAWLAGLLEGEGCFLRARRSDGVWAPKIQVTSTDCDIIEKVAHLFGGKAVGHVKRTEVQKEKGWKDYYRTALHGKPALEVMRRIRPLMGNRRGRKIDQLIGEFDG